MPSGKYSFIAALEFLNIDGPLGSDWTIAADLRISTSVTVAKRLLNSPLQHNIGKLETNAILSGKPFLFTDPVTTLSKIHHPKHR